MVNVTALLALATVAALLITMRRVVSWEWIARRAVFLDVAVTGFALWAFSGQGVTGTLVGVLTGLFFSITLHGITKARRIAHAAHDKAREAKARFAQAPKPPGDPARIVGLAWPRIFAALALVALPALALLDLAEPDAALATSATSATHVASTASLDRARILSRPMEATQPRPAFRFICSTLPDSTGPGC